LKKDGAKARSAPKKNIASDTLFTMRLLLFFSCFLGVTFASNLKTLGNVTSPNGELTFTVLQTQSGEVKYTVQQQTVDLLAPSALGVERSDMSFTTGLTLESTLGPIRIDELFRLSHGKQSLVRTYANETRFEFHNENGAKLQLVVRVSDDGVAFRYVFPEEATATYTVTKELSSFAFASDGHFWGQPYDKVTMYSPAYETFYTNGLPIGARVPFDLGTGWAFPALFKLNDHWLLLSEAGLDEHYFGAHLSPKPEGLEYTLAMPGADEALGYGKITPSSSLPWTLPWRVLIIGKSLATIVESTLVESLSQKSQIKDTSWIKPGKASWSWWSDHDSSRSFEKLKTFVDLAAEMGWMYSLVDANWNIMTGGSLEQLAAYARSKNVGLFVWYNSGGLHNEVTEQPRDLMVERETRRQEFARLQALGIKGVKVDFFQSDKQEIIKLYLDILKDAADFELMVNFHGSTLPRGWSRTYPNLMTMEAVRGAEQYTFSDTYAHVAPVQNTILPFTRNVVGPMDYTPVTFTDEVMPHETSNAHELALSVVFESGIIHLADSVEAYQSLPEGVKNFLHDVPSSWDETKYLAGEPGKFVVLARRSGNDWYIGGISGDKETRNLTLDLSFLKGDYAMMLIQDGTDNRSFEEDSSPITATESLTQTLQPKGGFVIHFQK
jgi:alpha-glucosidase